MSSCYFCTVEVLLQLNRLKKNESLRLENILNSCSKCNELFRLAEIKLVKDNGATIALKGKSDYTLLECKNLLDRAIPQKDFMEGEPIYDWDNEVVEYRVKH